MAAQRPRLLLDSGSERFVDRIMEMDEAKGFELLTYPRKEAHRINELLVDVDAVYVYQHEINGDAIRSARNLKFIQKHGLNCKNIDVAAAAARDIPVATLPLFRNVAVAEHAMALMLACAHKILPGHRAVAEGSYRGLGLEPMRTAQREYRSNWAKIPGVMEVMEATVGIIGLGDIGMEIAKRCSAFGMQIVYHQRARHSADVERSYQARYLPLPDLLAEVDYLILILPHTPETHEFIGAAELALMKPTATLINVARGGVVDEAALIEALSKGRLAMAGLDVFQYEPLPDTSPLISLPNVVLTPHLGGGSYRSRDIDHAAGINNIARFFRGERPTGLLS